MSSATKLAEEEIDFNNSDGGELEVDNDELEGKEEKFAARVGAAVEAIKTLFKTEPPIEELLGNTFYQVSSKFGLTLDPMFRTLTFKTTKFSAFKCCEKYSYTRGEEELERRELMKMLAIQLRRIDLSDGTDIVAAADDETIQCYEDSAKYRDFIQQRDTPHRLFGTVGGIKPQSKCTQYQNSLLELVKFFLENAEIPSCASDNESEKTLNRYYQSHIQYPPREHPSKEALIAETLHNNSAYSSARRKTIDNKTKQKSSENQGHKPAAAKTSKAKKDWQNELRSRVRKMSL
jgi:hypothetical protein